MAELHRPRNGRLGQVSAHSDSAHSDWMPLTTEVLPRRRSGGETPANRHLTHQSSSCKFSRNSPAGNIGTLQRTVGKLEGGLSAYVCSSGMAGIDAVFRLLRPGDHVVLSEAVYGGVFRLSTQLLVHFGLEFSFVDTSVLDFVRRALRPNTKMLYLETPANPTLSVTHIAAISNQPREGTLSMSVQ